jgi:hypothetical protein
MRLPLTTVAVVTVASTTFAGRADAGTEDCETGAEHCHDAHYSPAVGALGRDFFLGWSDYSHHRPSESQGRLVTVDGAGFGHGEVISLEQTDQPPPAAPELGFFLVWEDFAFDADLRAALVARDGLTVRVTQIPVATDVGRQRRPSVARAGGTHLVTWVLDGDAAVRARRVDLVGTVLDATPLGIAETALDQDTTPATASNGQDFLVVWDAPAPAGGREIRAARVKLDGTVLDPDGVVLWTSAGEISRPTVRSNGTHYLIAWRERAASTGVRALRVDANLAVLDPLGLELGPGSGATPDVASDGRDWLVVWDASGAVHARRVAGDGTLPDEAPLVLASGPQNELPDAASNGEIDVVAWTSERAPGWYDLRATRVTPDGAVLDPEGVVVAEASDHSGTMACAVGAPGAAHRRHARAGAVLLALLGGGLGLARRRGSR